MKGYPKKLWAIYDGEGFMSTVETSLKDAKEQLKFASRWADGSTVVEYVLVEKKKSKSKK